MELLVHGHGLLDLIVLDEDCLSLVELLIEDCKLRLNSEVVDAFLGHQLVDLSEVVGLGDVSESGVAPLGDKQVLLFESHLGDCLPVGLCLRCELQWIKDLDSSIKALILKCSTELNQGLVKVV